MTTLNPFCLSSYLAFRYVADPTQSWKEGIQPKFPHIPSSHQVEVGNAAEVLTALKSILDNVADPSRVGIFLSGGIDSGILARLLPPGTRAYTIDFLAHDFPRESHRASLYAKEIGLKLTVIEVTWNDYLRYEKPLMIHKKAPPPPVEVALYKASLQARKDGVDQVIIGNGADSTFGGLDKLLSKDWTFNEFIERYTFVKPETALRDPSNIVHIYEPYRLGKSFIDVQRFLKVVHGLGVVQAFDNAIRLAGLDVLQPYEILRLKGDLDLNRIRRGEPKYILKEVFAYIYPNLKPAPKVAFARPMDVWLKDYQGPTSHYFLDNLAMESFTGEQKYIIRCLDTFIHILEEDTI